MPKPVPDMQCEWSKHSLDYALHMQIFRHGRALNLLDTRPVVYEVFACAGAKPGSELEAFLSSVVLLLCEILGTRS